MGTGGVGGYFGGRLAAAGEDVSFIARGAHLEALTTKGLRVQSPKGDFHVPARRRLGEDGPTIRASSEPKALGPADVVLFTVKMYDVPGAAEFIRPLIAKDTVVITLQNGVEAVDLVSAAIGREHVAGGVAYVAAVITEPGVIKHTALDRLIFGELDGQVSDRLSRFKRACEGSGFDSTLSERIELDLWSKFSRLSVFSGMTAVTRSPIGPLRADPQLMEMVKAACEESIAVGRARGVPIPDSLMDEIVTMFHGMPPQSKSSMLEDLERGKRLELPWLSGAVVRLGAEAGVPTPIHQFIATVLRVQLNGA